MSELVRQYRNKSLLSSRTAVFAEDLMKVLEFFCATLKRDIAKLRDQLHVPITFNWVLGGYGLCHWSIDSSSDLWLDPPSHRLRLGHTLLLSMCKRDVGAGPSAKRTDG